MKNYEQDGKTLYKKDVTLLNGQPHAVYFFCDHEPKSGEPCPLPETKEVMKTISGMLVLKNKVK